MQQFAEPVTDAKGNAIAGALVTVFNLDGTLAPLFAADGVTGINNPVTTSRDGIALFCAANGNYRRRVTVDGRNLDVPGQIVLNAPSVNVTDAPFHARGDGLPHPLSERFATLAEAQAAYPHARALTDSQDWAAIQGALNTGRAVYLPKPMGRYKLNRELLFVTPGQRLYGDNPGSGSGDVATYIPYCGLEWFGTGERYVLTRRQPRDSSASPTDAPMSACINVQAEGVRLVGFSVMLETDHTDINSYGADWDIGVLNGCRAGFKTEDVHVIAYHRIANYYHDITRSSFLPELVTPYGLSFPRGASQSGSDQITHVRPFWCGGRYAEVRFGSIRSSGNYYNEATGALVSDKRGSSGSSDYVVYNAVMRGGLHPSGKRWADPLVPLNNANEPFGAGCQYIDGYAAIASGRITKQTYIFPRFNTEEIFASRLDHVGNIRYVYPHWEFGDRSVIPAAGGTPIDPSDTALYGYGTVSITANTGTVTITGPSTNEPSETWFWNIAQTVSPTLAKKMLIGSDGGNVRMSGGQLILDSGASIKITDGAIYRGDSLRTTGVDLNTIVLAGEYWAASITANGPIGASAVYLRVTTYQGSILQEAAPYGGATSATDVMYFRRFSAGTWHPWQRIATGQERPVTVLASSAVGVTGSAIATEETYVTLTVPANALGPNGQLRVTTLWSSTGSANVKAVSIKFGGTAFLANNITTNTATQEQTIVRNRGVVNSQVGHGLTLTSFGGTTGAVVTAAIDTSVDQTLLITGQKAVAGELLKLESYTVEILPS